MDKYRFSLRNSTSNSTCHALSCISHNRRPGFQVFSTFFQVASYHRCQLAGRATTIICQCCQTSNTEIVKPRDSPSAWMRQYPQHYVIQSCYTDVSCRFAFTLFCSDDTAETSECRWPLAGGVECGTSSWSNRCFVELLSPLAGFATPSPLVLCHKYKHTTLPNNNATGFKGF